MMSDLVFSNQLLKELPLQGIEGIYTRALDEKYAPTNRLINLLLTASIVLIMTALYFQPFISFPIKFTSLLPYVIWAVGVIGLLKTLHNSYADLKKRYALRELDLNYSSGLFFQKTVSQPINRIQHIELKRGPVERYVGMATLQVFSAGGAAHTFEIPGLPLESAQKLRHFILHHKDVSANG
jgi:membrane protein YdbS with pleckstrin-like domain